MPLPRELTALAERQAGLLSTAQCVTVGVTPTRLQRLARTGGWRRVTRGVYDTDATPVSQRHPDARRRRSALLGLLAFGPDAIAVGTSALVIHGVQGVPLGSVPQVTLPQARRVYSRDGIHARMFDDGMDVVEVGGLLAASVPWALAQAVPELGRVDAVSVMDSALHTGLITQHGLERAHDLARGRRGVARTHHWWDEADGRAESKLETRARLDCADHGMAPDGLQVPVVDVDGVRRRADLGWRLADGSWLLAEMDGTEAHGTLEAAYADRGRHNALTAAASGPVLRFTSRDLDVPGSMARIVRRTVDAHNARLRRVA